MQFIYGVKKPLLLAKQIQIQSYSLSDMFKHLTTSYLLIHYLFVRYQRVQCYSYPM